MTFRSLDNLGPRISMHVDNVVQSRLWQASENFDRIPCTWKCTASDYLPQIDVPLNDSSPHSVIGNEARSRASDNSSQEQAPVAEPAADAGKKKKLGPPSLLLDDPLEPDTKTPDNRSDLPSMGDAVDQWDAQIIEAADRWGVPAAQLKAMVWIETGGAGDPNAVQVNPYYGNTYGLTQINPKYWAEPAANLGYDLNTVEGQLGMGAYILRQGYDVTGSWDGASSWYFNPAGTGDAVNNTTNAEYIARMHELMGY